jgi:acyl-CoA synthetase (AMP-forming)/AMP-acid ligase II
MAEASLAVTAKPAGTVFETVGVDPRALALEGVALPGAKELVSVGRPVAGTEVQIRSESGIPLPADRVGHVVVHGPGVMAGYFGRPALTVRTLHSGWLDTGDLGFIHDGELYVCGRHKDVIVVRGANHAPEDFESVLEGLPGVRTGCAVAVGFVPNGQDDEALAMLVETNFECTPSLSTDIASRVEEHTGILPAVVELLPPGTLPRTSSGKLRRREALIQWLTGTLSPPKKVSATRLALEAANGELHHARAALARRRRAQT